MTMTPQRVTLITLGVADLTRSRKFYADLGWVATREFADVTFYQINGMVLGLFGLDPLAEDQGRAGTRLGTGAMTLAQNFTTNAEVDAAYAHAISIGARSLKEPQDTAWGGYGGYFSDPDGHVWELGMNPFWPLNADGSLTLPTQETDTPG
jgi:predicted lactoylglutathione lyase